MTKRVNLTSKGFVRRKEWDFSDDGSYFTCYDYKGLRISKTTYNGEYFIAVRHDYLPNEFTWEDWSKTEEYKLEDEFNGTYNVDVDKLVENCEKILAKVNELNKKVSEEPIDTELVRDTVAKEIAMAERELDNFKNSFKWWENEYKTKTMVGYIKSVEDSIDMLICFLQEKNNAKKLRYAEQQIKRCGYYKISRDWFYFTQFREALGE